MMREATCRLCLSTEGEMEEIFSSSDSKLHKRIYECTNIEIKNSSDLPSSICEICKSDLLISYKFRQQCFKSNLILKTIFPELFKDTIPGIFVKCESDQEDELMECVEIIDEEYEDSEQLNYSEEQEYSSVQAYYKNEPAEQVKNENSHGLETSILKYVAVKQDSNEESSENKVVLESGTDPSEHESQVNRIIYNQNLVRIFDELGSIRNNDNCKQEIDASRRELKIPLLISGTVKQEYEESSEYKVMIKSGQNPEEKGSQINKFISDADMVRIPIEARRNDDNFKQEINENKHELEIPLWNSEMVNDKYNEQSSDLSHMLKNNTDLAEKENKINKVIDGNLELKTSEDNLCRKTATNSKQNVLIHSDEKPFECNNCGRQFRQKLLYEHHIVSTHIEKYKCTICEMSFPKRNFLSHHMFKHQRENQHRHQCELCSKSFYNAFRLAAHRKIHAPDRQRNFKCVICEKIFVTERNLTKHIKGHIYASFVQNQETRPR